MASADPDGASGELESSEFWGKELAQLQRGKARLVPHAPCNDTGQRPALLLSGASALVCFSKFPAA